ncbi:DEAD/DEAH box helicase [Runella sp.]|jgi:ATP-dependent RNA helicase RhlE|uniref:DEAD/DEAH box helicase n=1 Tax=Runella sp. TaxID=1960881 RepID=UPI00261B5CC4|nr:DEAD/DEAH box helicase [Runella sp.]
MTFDELNLNKSLLNALDDLGYTTPTTIQQKVFSVVMSGKDVYGIAQTGTGKTLAYLLPCLRQFQFSKEKIPQLVIIVPTRELVVQVVESAKKLTKYMNLLVVGVYGGVNLKPQVAEVSNGVDILVATPGRLVDLLASGVVKPKAIKKFVIDEADEMLNLGFRAQLKLILDTLPVKRQNLLFSATITDEVEELMQTYFNHPVKVEATPAGTPLENIYQMAYDVPNFNTKVNLLELLLGHDPDMVKVLVFVATKHLADLVYEQLGREFGEQLGVIHSNKAQTQRFEAVNRFESGECRVLIATDIIARGLDVVEVSHVINFDMPEHPETYIHRIGRTGRVDKKGIAISFITENEKEQQEAIENLMQQPIPVRPLPKHLEISDELISEEIPRSYLKIPEVKIIKSETFGGAFHVKSEKNQKVNVRRNHAEEMMKKYGKPIRKSRKK